jgi:hypothetical protein
MKHAGRAALDRLEPLLRKLRAIEELREKSRGIFHRGGRAFLHFHEDPAGLFADVRFGDDFERLEATSAAQRAALLRRIRVCLVAGRKQFAVKLGRALFASFILRERELQIAGA